MKPVLALSTSWCSHRHHDGYAMLREMADLGFEHVELSHGIRIVLVPGILRAVAEGVVRISSTHNFCPLPTGVAQAAPNLFEPSAPGPVERGQWVRQTKRSIDFAAQVNAKALVCHLGRVRFSWFDPTRALRRYLEARPGAGRDAADTRYRALLEKSQAKLRRRMPAFQAHAKRSIEEVLAHAKARQVTLGFENREKFVELPLDADWVEFLAGFSADEPVGYWHDTGHAEIKEAMGLLRQREHLAALASRTIGFHLHDVNAEGRDHQAIGDGRIDFKTIGEFWRPEHLLTIELSPRIDAAGVQRSKSRVEALLR